MLLRYLVIFGRYFNHMTFLRRANFLSFIIFPIFCFSTAAGQKGPIGSWQSYLPYNSALGVATDGNTLYTICTQGFYTYSTLNGGHLEAYSKVNGMSDIGMQAVGYDIATSTAILAYADGNIDLFKDNTFYNVPELKIKSTAGAKTIYEVYTFNGYAYLSSALGVLVINLTTHTIAETYQFIANNQTIPVKSFLALGDYFYAATSNGVYRADRSNPQLQDFQVWTIIDTNKNYIAVKSVANQVFFANSKVVYKYDPAGSFPFYSSSYSIHHIDAGLSNLIVSEYRDSTFRASFQFLDPTNGAITDSFVCVANPSQVVQLLDSSLWIADAFGGLLRRTPQNNFSYFGPGGPLSTGITDIYPYNGDVWIAHGGFDDRHDPLNNRAGIANYNNGKWTHYTGGIYPPFNDLMDFIVLTKDESTGTLYAGSYQNGVFILNKDGSHQLVDNTTVFDPSVSIGNGVEIAGLALDNDHNLWVSSMYTQHQLYVKTADSQWYKFYVPTTTYGGPLLVDDNGQIWFITYRDGGITVYNHNGTISDPSDDVSYHLTTGVGAGNLPNNNVFCMAKDKNNNIWVGTADGIGIVNSCHPEAGAASQCDAEIPVVQYDKYAGLLFKGSNVRTIAVDGGNRKWVGTDDGVWLLSPDASKIVYNFTTDNSPLPSDHIMKIAVDPVTGLVYIATDQGMVSFRSTATDGGESNDNVISFPNPVPSGYTGTIAIKGLVANADVRITDVSGQLVYRTKALGGQAVWNGLDYTGRRPQSGVYLIFATNSDGSQTYTGKMVFLK